MNVEDKITYLFLHQFAVFADSSINKLPALRRILCCLSNMFAFVNRYSVYLCVFPENVQKLSDKEAPTQRQFVKGSGCSKLTGLPYQ